MGVWPGSRHVGGSGVLRASPMRRCGFPGGPANPCPKSLLAHLFAGQGAGPCLVDRRSGGGGAELSAVANGRAGVGAGANGGRGGAGPSRIELLLRWGRVLAEQASEGARPELRSQRRLAQPLRGGLTKLTRRAATHRVRPEGALPRRREAQAGAVYSPHPPPRSLRAEAAPLTPPGRRREVAGVRGRAEPV
ncbi:uncharacterized protein ACOB8E_015305 [Sarcophilus harrisii]